MGKLLNRIQYNVKAGLLGDSISGQKSSTLFQTCYKMGWRLSPTLYAVSGSKIEDQASKVQSMRSDGCNIALIQVGTNNVSDDVTTIYAKYKALISTCKGYDLLPVFCLIPQKEADKVSIVWKINSILRFVCEEEDLLLLNPWDSFTDISGGWASGCSSDEIHPTFTTRSEASNILVDKLTTGRDNYLLADTNSCGLLINPNFATYTGSNGLSNSWSTNANAYTTFDRISTENGRYAQRIIATNNPASTHSTIKQSVSAVPNHRYRLTFKGTVDCDVDLSSIGAYIKVQLIFGVSEGVSVTEVWSHTPIIGEFICDMIATSPEFTTNILTAINIYSGGFTATIGLNVERVLLVDETALSLP